MPKRITATAAKKFSAVLDEVEYFNQTFEVERHGRPIAEIKPPREAAPTRVSSGVTYCGAADRATAGPELRR